MRLFHVTAAGADIAESGFIDGQGSYGLASMTLRGVWVSDEPLDVNAGAFGDDIVEIQLPDSVDLGQFEVTEKFKGYREWCVPAKVLNHGHLVVHRGLAADALRDSFLPDVADR